MAESRPETSAQAKPASQPNAKPAAKPASQASQTSAAKPHVARRPAKPMWTARLDREWTSVRNQIVEALRGLKSPDRPTRRMAAFFALSLLGVVVMGGAMIRYLWIRTGATAIVTDDTETGKHLGEFLQRQSEEAKAKTLVQSLGSFTVELKAIPGSLSAPGVMNLAQVEIVVQCDTKETCAYIDRNQAPAKNQVIGVFISLDRDELLSREGKKRLRRKLIERLNSWLQNGRIEDVFFSKLIVS